MYIFLFIIILILIICNIIIISISAQMHNITKGGTRFKLKGGSKSTDLTMEIKNKVNQLIALKQNDSNLEEYSSKIKNMKQLTNKILNKL